MAPGITGVEHAGDGNDIFWGSLDAAGNLKFQTGDGANINSGGPINNDQWHHIVMTRDKDTGRIEIYVDGVLKNFATGDIGAKTTPFQAIGRVTDSPMPYFRLFTGSGGRVIRGSA